MKNEMTKHIGEALNKTRTKKIRETFDRLGGNDVKIKRGHSITMIHIKDE